MRAHSSGRVTSFLTERDGVRWRKILHLTGYDVSDAVRNTLALDISMSKYEHQLLTSSCLSSVPMEHLAPNGRIFMKFDT
jgi:hypothetical protein